MKLTTAEAIAELQKVDTLDMPARLCEAHYMAIEALKDEDDAEELTVNEAIEYIEQMIEWGDPYEVHIDACKMALEALKQTAIRCKDCKYFEYDHVENIAGIPLIVAHEICSKWGDGCKTKEDGYCYLFEPQESEGTDG